MQEAILWSLIITMIIRKQVLIRSSYRIISLLPSGEYYGDCIFRSSHPQDKLVRVLSGEVFDVAVDLRPGSVTYGKWFGVILSAENKKQFFIPKNFAHGFFVLSDYAEFAYKCTDFYHPNDEGGIIWNDPKIGIEWPVPEGTQLIMSEKDRKWDGINAFTEKYRK